MACGERGIPHGDLTSPMENIIIKQSPRKNRGVSTAGGNDMDKDVMETSHRKVFREAIRDLEDHLTGLMDGFIRGIQP